MRLDHLAVAAADLQTGVAWAEERLGVSLASGGQHAYFATHNRLLSLGPQEYFEVIAPDPSAPAPGRPRWFDLDHAPVTPRLANWIVAAEDLAALPVGPPVALSRGALNWELTVPDDGRLPRGAGLPTLIRWPAGVHPAASLPDHGLRMAELRITHPEAEALSALVAPHLADPRVSYAVGAQTRLAARIEGPTVPGGSVWLD